MARNEAASAHNEAFAAGYRKAGYVVLWKSNPKCCKACKALDGQELHGRFRPPFHSGCSCTVTIGEARLTGKKNKPTIMINGVEFNAAMNRSKQEEHIDGMEKFEKRYFEAEEKKKYKPSKFYKDMDIEKLVQPEVGKHNPRQKNSRDKAIEEYFSVPEIVGEGYNRDTKEYKQTRRICIKHNRKKGWHAYPVCERKSDRNGEG